MVAARHLSLWGYSLSYYYPRKSRHEHLIRLETQLKNLGIPEISTAAEVAAALSGPSKVNHVIDALFGFSFKPPMRPPFDEILRLLQESQDSVPITAVDIPSSWDVDQGPLEGNTYAPEVLVSLTGPKPAAKFFKGRHFVGGRFISKDFAAKWDFDIPPYIGGEQVVEVTEKEKL